MRSYPSMAESLDAKLDRYEEDYAQRPSDKQEPYLQPAFIQVFPERARAEIKSRIEETERRLAGIAVNNVVHMVIWDSPSHEKSPEEPHWVPRRRPPTPDGLYELAKSVQATIKHYSGATIQTKTLRKLLEDVFEAIGKGDTFTESENYKKLLYDKLRDAVLKHWTTDKTFFETLLRPTAEHGVDSGFWEGFLKHGFLLRQLKLVDDQPKEALELEPHLTDILKRRGLKPQEYFMPDLSTRESYFRAAAGERDEAVTLQANLAREAEQTIELPNGKWLISPRQRLFLLERLQCGHYIKKSAVNAQVAANLFDPSKDPLPWDGKEASQSNLAYFILTCVEGTGKAEGRDKLFEPSSRQYWVWAARCFIGKAKKTYDNKTLASEAHRFAKEGKHPEYIDDIINRTHHSPG